MKILVLVGMFISFTAFAVSDYTHTFGNNPPNTSGKTYKTQFTPFTPLGTNTVANRCINRLEYIIQLCYQNNIQEAVNRWNEYINNGESGGCFRAYEDLALLIPSWRARWIELEGLAQQCVQNN